MRYVIFLAIIFVGACSEDKNASFAPTVTPALVAKKTRGASAAALALSQTPAAAKEAPGAAEPAPIPTVSGDSANGEARFEAFLNYSTSSDTEVTYAGPFAYDHELECSSPKISYQAGKPSYQEFILKNLAKAYYCVKIIINDENRQVQFARIAFFSEGRVPNAQAGWTSPLPGAVDNTTSPEAKASGAEDEQNPELARQNAAEEKSPDCEELPPLAGTRYQITPGASGQSSSVTVSCQPNYLMLGTPNASCVQGKWVNLASCAPCGGINALPTVENGIVESHEGGQLTLKCQEGFTASGATSARCSDEDPERRSVGTCKKNCSDPTKLEIPFLRGYDEGSEFVLAKDGSIPHGVSINNLSCKSGFALVGNSHFTCNDGKWWNEKEKPRCAKSCSNFPLGIVHGAYQYSDKNPRLHGDGTQISALQCDPGYIAEGFAPLTCSQGEWKGDNLGTCVIDSSLGVTLTGPVVSDASFYIYLFLNRERVAGYLIDESLYATFKEKNYSVSIEPGKIYDLGVECGDFRESQGGKSGAQHRKFTSSKKITFTAGEHLSVSCGGISSDRQAELPIQEVVLSNGEAKL